ncbi:MAG TPA: phosphatidate cytidylyltransferase [Rhizomicrobium sp.]|nr:phosphatidate cytidylyltransferase [Rhizomicrobium sp.]
MKRLASITAHADHAPGYRGITLNWDWVTRPLFGAALAALVVAATYGGAPYVALYAAIAGVAAAREWHRMVGERVFGPIFLVTSAALVAALAAAVLWPDSRAQWAIIVAGATAAAALAALRGAPAVWHGIGALYIGIPMLAVVALRGAAHGAWIIVGMFLAIWATDTGALFTGNLVGGPKLWPALSPNKTWAGTFGGIVAAAVVESVYIAVLGGHVVAAALLGAAIAVVAHCGDLFESWVKRVFQRKDSGGMIPGHGGVLDRIDSTLFAAPVLTLVVLATGLDPTFGAHL